MDLIIGDRLCIGKGGKNLGVWRFPLFWDWPTVNCRLSTSRPLATAAALALVHTIIVIVIIK